MTDNTTDKARETPGWERLFLRALVGGVAIGLILICAVGFFYLEGSRMKPWDLRAIQALEPKTEAVDLSVGLMAAQDSSSASNPASDPGRRGKSVQSSYVTPAQNMQTGRAVVVAADLQNTTGDDITLSRSTLVMESEQDTRVLHNSQFKLDREYFLPARHAVSVMLQADDPCAPENTPEMCADSYFHGVDEIVLFDPPGRHEIHIPLSSIRLLRVEPGKPAGMHVWAPSTAIADAPGTPH